MFRRLRCAAWCGAALLVLSVGLGGCTLGGRGTAVPTATVALAVPTSPPIPSATPAPSATLPPPATVAATNTATPRPQSTATAAAAVDGRIAFHSDRDGKNEIKNEIYVMNADGTGLTRLTNNPAMDGRPAWSPDGRKIAFESSRDGNSEIYVMNADGTGVARLTNNPTTDNDPAWSPDGRKIAFSSGYPRFSIYVMNTDGTGLTRLTNNAAQDERPAWSPDGRKIAFVSNRDDEGRMQIYVMNADGTGQTRLISDTVRDLEPAWSPDGRRIAFVSDRDGDWEIYVMNSDGTGVTRLTNSPDWDGGPAWSPDGSRIAFSSRRDGGNYEIYVMNADGSAQTRLTNNPAIDDAPAWSPRPPSTATAAAAGRVSVDQGGVRFAYDPSLAQNVIFKVEPAIDMDGVKRPAYRSYELQGYPVTATYGPLAQFSVFSVAEYIKTQPAFTQTLASLTTLLASGQDAWAADASLPAMAQVHIPRLGQARLSQLAFAQGSGLRYLAQHAQTMAPFTNPFHYHFVGLTSDKQYYVEVTFRINASIVRGQPQVNNIADWEKVREFNRTMERQLGELAASGFEPNLDLLDDLVRSIVVSAPTGAAQASAMTPAPTKALATSASAGAPCITRFGISSTEAKPGDKVTLTWQASGDRAFVTHDEEWGALSEEFVEVPLAGTYTFTINPTLRRRAITYMLNVRVGEAQTWSTGLVYITCPDNWFFASNSVDCPAPALRTTIVAQRFQRGVMLWSSANKRIYVLERPDGQRTWMDDTWKEGMPDSDPSIVAPSGLYQPVRGFGLVWRTAKMLPDALVRDRLGWATGPESAIGEGFVQEWPHGKGGDVFITGPDKDVYVLYGMGGWRVYATPTPGPTPTHPAATPVVETCRSAALPPSATVAPTSAAAGRVSVNQGGVRFAYDRTLADKVVFTFEPKQYPRHFNIPAYRKYVFEDHNSPDTNSAKVKVYPSSPSSLKW